MPTFLLLTYPSAVSGSAFFLGSDPPPAIASHWPSSPSACLNESYPVRHCGHVEGMSSSVTPHHKPPNPQNINHNLDPKP